MGTNQEHREERLTLARVHAVLAATSIVMIGQITSANTITPELHSAVWYFGASILLNAFFYVLETDPYAPRYKSKLSAIVLVVPLVGAFGSTLGGVGCIMGHFSALAGNLFSVFGGLLLVYVTVVLFKNRIIALRLQSDATRPRVNELNREMDELLRQTEEIKRELDYEALRQTAGESAADPPRKQEIADRLKDRKIEFERLSAQLAAILDSRDRAIDAASTILPTVLR